MAKRGKNKRGLEIVWNVWVIMIIAFIVLIFVIVFFTTSSGSFIDNVKNYFSRTNVDSVVKGCNILSDSGNRYEFCCDKKSVNYLIDDEIKREEFSCFELVNKSFVNNEINNAIKCEEFSCYE